MANRYWKLHWGTVYAGTDTCVKIDACDYLNYDPKELEDMDEKRFIEELNKIVLEEAQNLIEAWVEVDESPDEEQ